MVPSVDIRPPAPQSRRPHTRCPGLAHKVLDDFDRAGGPVLPATAKRPRALAEPRLEAWAERLLGSLHQVRCRVEFLPATGDTPIAARELRLDSLGLSELDAVFMTIGGESGGVSDLEAIAIATAFAA